MGDRSMGQCKVGVVSFQEIYGLYSEVKKGSGWVVLCGFGKSDWSVWVMGEWSVCQWLAGSFRKYMVCILNYMLCIVNKVVK